jgi:hypothetical protein
MANQQIDEAPVVFTDPMSGEIELMPIEMIAAYVPYASDLRLEEAAKVAAIRDDEAATNLKLSCADTEYLSFTLPEGASLDTLAAETS